MPSEYQAAQQTERPTFPDLADDIGEDPARFLALDLISNSPGTGDGHLIQARIRGIDRLDVLRAWLAVERRLYDGGRDRVLAWLDKREAQLERLGDRGERNSGERDRAIPEKEWVWVVDGEERDERPTRAGAALGQSYATDGGRDGS